MPRRGYVPRREVLPDPLYNSVVVTKLINQIMNDGKKGVAQKVCYVFGYQEKMDRSPFGVRAGDEQRHASAGGRARAASAALTYQVPIEIRPERRQTLPAVAGHFLRSGARSVNDKAERLAAEIMDAANQTGNTFKKKEDTHKMAEANRAFAHYRWW